MKMDYRGTVERVFNEFTFTLPSANRPLNGLTAELEQGTHASLYKDEEIILDCLVIDPITAEPQRPYLKLIIDRYSRTVIERKYCK